MIRQVMSGAAGGLTVTGTSVDSEVVPELFEEQQPRRHAARNKEAIILLMNVGCFVWMPIIGENAAGSKRE